MTLLKQAEEIGAELAARLQAVRVANGYETDIGASVMRGYKPVVDTMIPCAVVIEGGDEVSNRSADRVGTHYNLKQGYALMAYVPCEPLNPNDAAHAAIRDLKRAIFRTAGKPDWRLGGKVMRVEYRGRDIGPRGDGLKFVLALIEIDVEFVEDVANP